MSKRPGDGYGGSNWRMLSAPEAKYLAALEAVARAAERVRPYEPGWEKRTEKVWEATARLSRPPRTSARKGSR